MKEQFLAALFSTALGLVSGWIAHDVSNLDAPDVEPSQTIPLLVGDEWFTCEAKVGEDGDVENVQGCKKVEVGERG